MEVNYQSPASLFLLPETQRTADITKDTEGTSGQSECPRRVKFLTSAARNPSPITCSYRPRPFTIPAELFSLPPRNKEVFRKWNTYCTDVVANHGCTRNWLGFHHFSLSTIALRLFENTFTYGVHLFRDRRQGGQNPLSAAMITNSFLFQYVQSCSAAHAALPYSTWWSRTSIPHTYSGVCSNKYSDFIFYL